MRAYTRMYVHDTCTRNVVSLRVYIINGGAEESCDEWRWARRNYIYIYIYINGYDTSISIYEYLKISGIPLPIYRYMYTERTHIYL